MENKFPNLTKIKLSGSKSTVDWALRKNILSISFCISVSIPNAHRPRDKQNLDFKFERINFFYK